MAKTVGLSLRAVQRMWQAHHLQPHCIRTFKRSNDPAFAEKVDDIVGLYMHPPAAVVLSIDEKSQIQALDRTQPGLPLKKGRAGTMTHDYKRHGTTTLFAALDVKAGTVIGRCAKRHRHQEFIRFLGVIDQRTPADLNLHLVVDNYATHKHPTVKAWLAEYPRFHMYFTPTLSSWLNLVERFFAEVSASVEASSRASPTSRSPSSATSRSTTNTPSPSSGPPRSSTSSTRSSAGSKCWSRNTSSSPSPATRWLEHLTCGPHFAKLAHRLSCSDIRR